MKLGIMSDSHDNLPLIAKAVDVFNRENVDLVLHAGDFISPFTASKLKGLNARFVGVFGNNDGDKLFLLKRFQEVGELYEEFWESEVEGKRIIMFHKPDFVEAVIAGARHDVVIYGHTHKLDIREGSAKGGLVINPGECGGWITGRATVVILNLETMKPVVFDL
ncbi:MAG: metallophosphoesterase [Dehalococcoidia bacterium]